jgi:hypothetical protein
LRATLKAGRSRGPGDEATHTAVSQPSDAIKFRFRV